MVFDRRLVNATLNFCSSVPAGSVAFADKEVNAVLLVPYSNQTVAVDPNPLASPFRVAAARLEEIAFVLVA